MGMKRNLSRKLSSAEPKTAQNTWVLAMNASLCILCCLISPLEVVKKKGAYEFFCFDILHFCYF